jgi:hypothetical protein
MSVSVDPVLLKQDRSGNNFICCFTKEDLSIQTMALNRDKSLLVLGGRREFRVLGLTKEAGVYAKIDELVKFSGRRSSMDYGIFDV